MTSVTYKGWNSRKSKRWLCGSLPGAFVVSPEKKVQVNKQLFFPEKSPEETSQVPLELGLTFVK